jgi:dienelactone hydrolase
MRITRRAVALALVLGLVAACGSTTDGTGPDAGAAGTIAPGSTTPATTDPDLPLAVGEVTETFVDRSRPTNAGAETPARPERTIPTRIVYPASGGPYPLLVLAHGASGHPDEFAEQIPAWAADGFVIAAPEFPLTNRDVPSALLNFTDVANQPGDVSFVIDSVLAASDDPDSPLHGLVDPTSIGMVGHSLGGATTWAVAFNTATRDERIDSATVFAGLTLDMPGGEFAYDSGLPLLVMHGDADDVPITMDLAAYQQAAAPKWFVTLIGADHRLAFTDEASPYDELVTRTIVDFWHGTLDGDAEALDRVTDDATDPELSTVRHNS